MHSILLVKFLMDSSSGVINIQTCEASFALQISKIKSRYRRRFRLLRNLQEVFFLGFNKFLKRYKLKAFNETFIILVIGLRFSVNFLNNVNYFTLFTCHLFKVRKNIFVFILDQKLFNRLHLYSCVGVIFSN